MSWKHLCVILFSSGLLALAQGRTPSFSEPIIVWSIGSPHTGDTPDTTVPLDLKLRSEKLGSGIRISAFPAKGFSQIFFDAFESHQEPDIITFDNIGILDGITTELAGFTGIRSSPRVRNALIQVTGSLKNLTGGFGGWQFLISTSKNYQAARTLALQPPECDTNSVSEVPPPSDLQSISKQISGAFLAQSGSLKPFEDRDRLVAGGVRRGPAQSLDTEACGYWGNDHLAFVSMLSSYQSAKEIGQLPVLLVLRKQDDKWSLLVASTDPISNAAFLRQLRPLPGLLTKLWGQRSEVQPAELLLPEDGRFPHAEHGERFGAFTWSPSQSEDVVAEIVEFAYQGDARLVLRLREQGAATEQLSAGVLWTTGSEWKWRVWSVSDAGMIAFSRARMFPH